MSNFSSYLEKSPIRRPGVVVTWGRYNPPTRGHEMVFNEAAALANAKDYELRIYATHSSGDERNPLAYDLKLQYLKELFPRYRNYLVEDYEQQFRTINAIIRSCEKEFNNFCLIVGEDRVDDFRTMLLEKMETSFRNIEVWSAGQRDPDRDDITGLSSSKMRALAEGNDLNRFREGLPASTSRRLAEALLKDVRRGLKAPPKPLQELERTPAREDFYKGDLTEGMTVITPQGPGILQAIGANHYTVILETEVKNFWPKDVRPLG